MAGPWIKPLTLEFDALSTVPHGPANEDKGRNCCQSKSYWQSVLWSLDRTSFMLQ